MSVHERRRVMPGHVAGQILPVHIQMERDLRKDITRLNTNEGDFAVEHSHLAEDVFTTPGTGGESIIPTHDLPSAPHLWRHDLDGTRVWTNTMLPSSTS